MLSEYEYQQRHDQEILSSIYVAATVKILRFDPEKMIVDVQPLSKRLEGETYQSQPPILNVPVALTRCGGFVFRPWFKEGDIGVVIFLDHDIDATISEGCESEPVTDRIHSTDDAVFVGSIVTGKFKMPSTIPEESIALSTEDGKSYVAVSSSKVKIKATTVDIEGTAINLHGAVYPWG